MKKLLTAAMIIISFNVNAQAYLSTGITSKGVAVNIGILTNNIDASVGVKMPFTSKESATIFNLQMGRQILLTNNEEDNYFITPKVGYAKTRFSTFDNKLSETKHRTKNAIYSLELGKDGYMGRFYLKGWYCRSAFLEVGMRVFVGR